MALLTMEEVRKMSEKERNKKIKELRKELVKQSASTEEKVKPKEIKKAIARLLSVRS